MTRSACATVVCLLLCGTSAAAQDPVKKAWVEVNHDGDDLVGTEVTFHLKEAIARSSRFELSGLGGEISLVSLDIDGQNAQSALSVMYKVSVICQETPKKTAKNAEPRLTSYNLHTHRVMVLGRNRAEHVATQIFAGYSAYRDSVGKSFGGCNLI